MPGCPEDRKRDGGRGGRSVVASRGWEGRYGRGEEAEKTGVVWNYICGGVEVLTIID